ncbi:protein kinase domain-containing protein [Streptomyces pratensis]|uniref:protein kinase domain-containing protein n=1 Tax=Streptomyces pratensis TaxID=1169025 RepID=UPI001933B06F
MSEFPGTGRVVADRYRLLDPLGEGATSIVWRARDEVLGREVAVKEVRAPGALPAADTERLHSRLEREARAAARVSHRNVVAVHDVITHDARPWIVMELIRGIALSDVLEADGPLPPRRAARIGAEVLTALRGGHAAGVLHRDVRPGNVMLANDGRVMLKGFGLTTTGKSHASTSIEEPPAPATAEEHHATATAEEPPAVTVAEERPAFTVAGEPAGSAEYLAPERALGRAPGPESDLWSLGVLLYAATEGRSPFGRDTPADAPRTGGDEELRPLRRAGALTPVVEGLLRKDPAERLTAGEAERRLRILAAGGTGSPGGGEAGPQLPQPADGAAATAAGSGAAPGPPEPAGRARRTGVLVAAGAVVALLIAGGLVWALTGDDDSDRGGDGKAPAWTSVSSWAADPAGARPASARGGGDGLRPARTGGSPAATADRTRTPVDVVELS